MHRSTKLALVFLVLMIATYACSKDAATASKEERIDMSNAAPAPAIGYSGGVGGVGAGGMGASARVTAGSPKPGRPGSREETYVTSMDAAVADTSMAAEPAPNQSVTPGSLPVDAVVPMIVRTGSATIKVDYLAPAIAKLLRCCLF